MGEQLELIAKRIKWIRESCDYTAEQLADELGIERNVYLDYEENGLDIPISVIFDIARKFSIDFNELLTGHSAHIDTYSVTPADKGVSVDRFPGYRFFSLAGSYAGKKMEPLIVEVEPKNEKPSLITHDGQEFNYVLSGSIKVFFDNREIVLNEGDSVYFNPKYPHGQAALGGKNAKFLTVILN